MPVVLKLVRPPVRGDRRAMLDTLLRHLRMVRLQASAAIVLAALASACAGVSTCGAASLFPRSLKLMVPRSLRSS